MWTRNNNCNKCHRRKCNKLWKKLQWNLTQSGRNQKKLPGRRIIRISTNDHYKKRKQKSHGTSQNLKHIQGDKIIGEEEGIKTRTKGGEKLSKTHEIMSKEHLIWKVFRWPNMRQSDYNGLKDIKIKELIRILIKW